MDEGYIKLYRSMNKWEWYSDVNTKAVFLHLLLNANLEESRFKNHVVPKGSLVIGRKSLAATLGITERNVRTALKHLKMTNEVTIISTNKFSIVTVVNWEKYQANAKRVTNKPTNELTNNRPTSDQQVTTEKEYKNKEYKNIKEEYKEENSPSVSNTMEDIQNLFNSVCIFFEPCSVITKTRMEKIKLLLKKYSYEDIRNVFEKANGSDFLLGKNDRGWKASFDWLIDIDNFVKVKEENYKSASTYKAPAEKPKTDIYRGYTFDELEKEIKGEHK